MGIINNISRWLNLRFNTCYFLQIQFSKKQRVPVAIALLFIVTPAMAQESEQALTPVNDQVKTCTMGVFPFISAQRLEQVFAPVAAELSEAMACSLRFRSASSFESFMTKLGNAEFDVAFIQPFDYVQIARPQGYIPLVARNEDLHAVIVTLKNNDVRKSEDLRGKIIALPPAVAAVSYIALDMLEKAGLHVPEDVAVLHSNNHGSCIHKVIIGKVDACVVSLSTLRLLEARHHRKLRVIAQSEALPNALFVVRGDVSDKKYLALQNRMLHLASGEQFQQFFNSGEKNPFRITDDSEYDIVRLYCKKFRAIPGVSDNVQCRIPETLDGSTRPLGGGLQRMFTTG